MTKRPDLPPTNVTRPLLAVISGQLKIPLRVALSGQLALPIAELEANWIPLPRRRTSRYRRFEGARGSGAPQIDGLYRCESSRVRQELGRDLRLHYQSKCYFPF